MESQNTDYLANIEKLLSEDSRTYYSVLDILHETKTKYIAPLLEELQSAILISLSNELDRKKQKFSSLRQYIEEILARAKRESDPRQLSQIFSSLDKSITLTNLLAKTLSK